MIVRRLLAAPLLLLAAPAISHDFWIEPARFRVAAGDSVPLRLLIGEQAAPEHWPTEWRRIVSLQDFAPAGILDWLGAIRPLDGARATLDRIDASVTLAAPGTHMIAFASNQATSDLKGDEFNAYATHEGLAVPLARRAAQGQTAANGRELYSRRAKALIQVGDQPTDSVSRPIGQTLEIVPDRNPYMLNSGAPMRVRVLFHGKPLAGASVVLERLGAARPASPSISDAKGYVRFSRPDAGNWKINVVWSYPIDDPRADYETIFSSLTFGI